MAIEKMKKLRLLAVRDQKKALLRKLMLLGCIEVSEPELSELSPELRQRYHKVQDRLCNADSGGGTA